MSKIGKKPIVIPKGVEIKVDDRLISVKGPKGSLSMKLDHGVVVSVTENEIKVDLSKGRNNPDIWGLTRALIANMILGVINGFEKVLEFEGVGYKANVKGNDLELNLGYSHPIKIKAPEGIAFSVEKSTIKVIGIDKQLVGQVAAEIRSKRLPEPYRGSGIKYAGEIIKRKAGKKAATTG